MWGLSEFQEASYLSQILYHRPISKTYINALDSLLPASNRYNSTSVGSYLKFSLGYRKMSRYSLSSLLLLPFLSLELLIQISCKNCSHLTIHGAWDLWFPSQTKERPAHLKHSCYMPSTSWEDGASHYRPCLHNYWEKKWEIMAVTHKLFNPEALTEKAALTVSTKFCLVRFWY